ncbi:Family of serine hydrolases 3 [Coemansia sp. RSA 1933]|nr:Family of serine hydrolases 3 [Coemansia sp. RSA 1933]
MHSAAHSSEPYDGDVSGLIESVRSLQPLKFAMFFAGFYPDMPQFEKLLVGGAEKINVPSLHMVGKNDAVVPMERGRELAERAFAEAVVMEHEGGHFVPCNAEWRGRYQEFLDGIDSS